MGLFTSFQLKSRDAETRRRAALSLGVRGKTANSASLEPLLGDPEWAVRQAAIEALGHIGDPSAVPAVVEAVRNADEVRDAAGANALRAAAVEALGRIGAAGVGPLLEALRDRHARLRETAIAALGAIGGPAAVAALTGTLRDDRSSVRQAGVAALARAAGPAAVPALHEALGHKDPTTRRSAAVALGGISDAAAVAALQTALAERDRAVRDAALDALAAIGSHDAAAALIAGMRAGDREMKGATAARLKGMAWTPGTPEERAVHAALHGRFDDALAEGPIAVDPLVAALGDRDPVARRAAAAALGHLADPRAAAALAALFKDTDSAVREASVAAIGAIGLPAADAVLEALRDRSATVRAAGDAALSRLGAGRVAGHLLAILAVGSAARHAGRDLRVVGSRAELDGARQAADALDTLVSHAVRALPPDLVQRCAVLADVILLEPGEVPGHSETVDVEGIRSAAGEELRRRQ